MERVGTEPYFSPSEQKLLDILERRKEVISSVDLIPLFYGDTLPPENARQVIGGLIRSLVNKTQRRKNNRVRRFVNRPAPTRVWMEHRP